MLTSVRPRQDVVFDGEATSRDNPCKTNPAYRGNALLSLHLDNMAGLDTLA